MHPRHPLIYWPLTIILIALSVAMLVGMIVIYVTAFVNWFRNSTREQRIEVLASIGVVVFFVLLWWSWG